MEVAVPFGVGAHRCCPYPTSAADTEWLHFTVGGRPSMIRYLLCSHDSNYNAISPVVVLRVEWALLPDPRAINTEASSVAPLHQEQQGETKKGERPLWSCNVPLALCLSLAFAFDMRKTVSLRNSSSASVKPPHFQHQLCRFPLRSPLIPLEKMRGFSHASVINEFEALTKDAGRLQRETLREILEQNGEAEYLHNFDLGGRTDPDSFKACIPLVTHSDLEPYIQRIADGDTSPVLTGKPITSISLR
ncbi:hypothetical protein BHE74_00041126 [Ensete ventricosum]|nr:hypothetical protein GW17_00042847 [Ensete ventricosum]RWW52447.1 hypothetical protein BHE74_00041126 [Ensete ventricosum]